MKENVVYLINNDLNSINEAITQLEEEIAAVMAAAVEEGLHPATATGILNRVALGLSIEYVDE